ncbi:hypothetical protein D3C80_1843830 [compost metagenome]
MRKLDFLAVLVLDLREFQVCIIQHAEDRAWCRADIADLREQRFFILGQNMCLLAAHFLQCVAVFCKRGILYEAIKQLIG